MNRNQVVVAYDFTKPADVALQRAIELACRDREQVLHFVTVLTAGETYVRAGEVQQDLLARLRLLFGARDPNVDVHFCVHTRIGDPVTELLAVSEELGADLIILGSHDRGAMGRVLLGSVSEAVLRGARCPVLIAKPKGYDHVVLEDVVEVPHGPSRSALHRYSHTASVIQMHATGWPLD